MLKYINDVILGTFLVDNGISLKEIAKILKVRKATIRKWLCGKTIPYKHQIKINELMKERGQW